MLGTDHVIDCGGRASQLGLNDLIACIAVRHHAIPVNMYPAFLGHPEYTVDGVHPTNAGHAFMAGLFETTITYGGLVAGLPPTITVGTPTVQSTQATVSAAINPNGRSTVWRVQYGTTTSYNSRTPAETLSAADVEQPVTAMLTGLRPATHLVPLPLRGKQAKWIGVDYRGSHLHDELTIMPRRAGCNCRAAARETNRPAGRHRPPKADDLTEAKRTSARRVAEPVTHRLLGFDRTDAHAE
ncbi:MAG TPA: hypothetical protein VGF81_01440 [Solirubrobacteraceae bacterium]